MAITLILLCYKEYCITLQENLFKDPEPRTQLNFLEPFLSECL